MNNTEKKNVGVPLLLWAGDRKAKPTFLGRFRYWLTIRSPDLGSGQRPLQNVWIVAATNIRDFLCLL
jgi:hypothetical protein